MSLIIAYYFILLWLSLFTVIFPIGLGIAGLFCMFHTDNPQHLNYAIFVVLGMVPRASCMLGMYSTTTIFEKYFFRSLAHLSLDYLVHFHLIFSTLDRIISV
jgi:hypothetical protein